MAEQSSESEDLRRIAAFTIELRINDTPTPEFFHFPNNPISVSFTEAARVTPQQTRRGHYLEEWGPGFKQIQIEGHTGFAKKAPLPGIAEVDGYQAFKNLVKIYRLYLDTTKANIEASSANRKNVSLLLHMWEEDEHWRVVPSGNDALRRTRSDRSPMLFNYSLSLTGYEDAKEDTAKLGQGLLFGPTLGDLLGDLAGRDTQLGQFGAALNGLSARATAMASDLAKIRQNVADINAAAKFGANALKAQFSGIIAVASECGRLMKEVTALVSAPLRLVSAIARGLRSIKCAFDHLGDYVAGLFGGITGPYQSAWRDYNNVARRC